MPYTTTPTHPPLAAMAEPLLHEVQAAYAHLLTHHVASQVELELRLGCVDPAAAGGFNSHVTPRVYAACLAMAQAPSSGWQVAGPSQLLLDSFYPPQLRVRQVATLTATSGGQTSSIQKITSCKHDFVVAAHRLAPPLATLRLALALEQPMALPPPQLAPTQVRLKQQQRFFYTSRHFPQQPCVVLECSTSWYGPTEHAVRTAWSQAAAHPTQPVGPEVHHAVELEVLHPPYVLQHPAPGPLAGLHGLVQKMVDFCAQVEHPTLAPARAAYVVRPLGQPPG